MQRTAAALLLLSLAAGCEALALSASPSSRFAATAASYPQQPLLRRRLADDHNRAAAAAAAAVMMCSAAEDQPAIDVDATPSEDSGAVTPAKRGGIRAWFAKWMKFDREQLGKLGVDAFFTYGVVSNINAALTVALAWGTFSRTTGLSPLVPGQWPKFAATYFAIYLSVGSLLRPVRLAAAVGLTPVYTRVVARVQDSMPFRTTRPKLNRTLALVVISFGLNTLGTCAIIGLGIWLAGVVTGVPAFPPGFKLPFGPGAAAVA